MKQIKVYRKNRRTINDHENDKFPVIQDDLPKKSKILEQPLKMPKIDHGFMKTEYIKSPKTETLSIFNKDKKSPQIRIDFDDRFKSPIIKNQKSQKEGFSEILKNDLKSHIVTQKSEKKDKSYLIQKMQGIGIWDTDQQYQVTHSKIDFPENKYNIKKMSGKGYFPEIPMIIKKRQTHDVLESNIKALYTNESNIKSISPIENKDAKFNRNPLKLKKELKPEILDKEYDAFDSHPCAKQDSFFYFSHNVFIKEIKDLFTDVYAFFELNIAKRITETSLNRHEQSQIQIQEYPLLFSSKQQLDNFKQKLDGILSDFREDLFRKEFKFVSEIESMRRDLNRSKVSDTQYCLELNRMLSVERDKNEQISATILDYKNQLNQKNQQIDEISKQIDEKERKLIVLEQENRLNQNEINIQNENLNFEIIILKTDNIKLKQELEKSQDLLLVREIDFNNAMQENQKEVSIILNWFQQDEAQFKSILDRLEQANALNFQYASQLKSYLTNYQQFEIALGKNINSISLQNTISNLNLNQKTQLQTFSMQISESPSQNMEIQDNKFETEPKDSNSMPQTLDLNWKNEFEHRIFEAETYKQKTKNILKDKPENYPKIDVLDLKSELEYQNHTKKKIKTTKNSIVQFKIKPLDQEHNIFDRSLLSSDKTLENDTETIKNTTQAYKNHYTDLKEEIESLRQEYNLLFDELKRKFSMNLETTNQEACKLKQELKKKTNKNIILKNNQKEFVKRISKTENQIQIPAVDYEESKSDPEDSDNQTKSIKQIYKLDLKKKGLWTSNLELPSQDPRSKIKRLKKEKVDHSINLESVKIIKGLDFNQLKEKIVLFQTGFVDKVENQIKFGISEFINDIESEILRLITKINLIEEENKSKEVLMIQKDDEMEKLKSNFNQLNMEYRLLQNSIVNPLKKIDEEIRMERSNFQKNLQGELQNSTQSFEKRESSIQEDIHKIRNENIYLKSRSSEIEHGYLKSPFFFACRNQKLKGVVKNSLKAEQNKGELPVVLDNEYRNDIDLIEKLDQNFREGINKNDFRLIEPINWNEFQKEQNKLIIFGKRIQELEIIREENVVNQSQDLISNEPKYERSIDEEDLGSKDEEKKSTHVDQILIENKSGNEKSETLDLLKNLSSFAEETRLLKELLEHTTEEIDRLRQNIHENLKQNEILQKENQKLELETKIFTEKEQSCLINLFQFRFFFYWKNFQSDNETEEKSHEKISKNNN